MGRVYDHLAERPEPAVLVNATVAAYCLTRLEADTRPPHPFAHADALTDLRNALGKVTR